MSHVALLYHWPIGIQQSVLVFFPLSSLQGFLPRLLLCFPYGHINFPGFCFYFSIYVAFPIECCLVLCGFSFFLWFYFPFPSFLLSWCRQLSRFIYVLSKCSSATFASLRKLSSLSCAWTLCSWLIFYRVHSDFFKFLFTWCVYATLNVLNEIDGWLKPSFLDKI